MWKFVAMLAVTGFSSAAHAGEISSVYTDLVAEKDCVTY